MRRTHRSRRPVAVALTAATAALALTALSAPADAAVTASVKPTSGPVGTTIKVSGTCPDLTAGYDTDATIKLYYPDAFESIGGFSEFHSVDVSATAKGAFSGSIKVGPAHEYTKAGKGPAQPGETLLRKPKAGDTIKVQVVCYQPGISAYPISFVAGDRAFSVTRATLSIQEKPSVLGTTKVGRTVTAANGSWTPKPTSFSYQWQRNGTAIPRATNRSYQLTSKDKGKRISVVVTAKRAGFAPTRGTSAARLVR